MSGASKFPDLTEVLKHRIADVGQIAPESIGDLMAFRVVESQPDAGIYTLRCRTFPWMRNAAGTLHGGMCATVVDQAMGFVAFCAKPGQGHAPTVQLQLSYHRPLIPGEEVDIQVRLVSVSKSLMHLSAEAALTAAPEKLCLSASAVYFYKPAE